MKFAVKLNVSWNYNLFFSGGILVYLTCLIPPPQSLPNKLRSPMGLLILIPTFELTLILVFKHTDLEL